MTSIPTVLTWSPAALQASAKPEVFKGLGLKGLRVWGFGADKFCQGSAKATWAD